MAIKNWTSGQKVPGFQAQKSMWIAKTFNLACNLPGVCSTCTGKMASGDSAYLIKLQPYTTVLAFAAEICTAEATTVAGGFGLCGACFTDVDGLDASVCLCAAAGTKTVGVPGTDAALIAASTNQCDSYVRLCTTAVACTAKFRIRMHIARAKDHA